MLSLVAYFADLTPYRYGKADGSVNVGWLCGTFPYATGQVTGEVVTGVLRSVLLHPVNRSRGWHRCELCTEPACPVVMSVDGIGISLGDCEVRVPGAGQVIYAAPSLVAHYIVEHLYFPPQGFTEAVGRLRW
jgi:hypothetical protein